MAAAVLEEGRGHTLHLMHKLASKFHHLRFIDDPHDVEASNGASVLSGLSLGIVEVGGDCYHGMSHLVSQVGLCCFLERRGKGREGWRQREMNTTQWTGMCLL